MNPTTRFDIFSVGLVHSSTIYMRNPGVSQKYGRHGKYEWMGGGGGERGGGVGGK